MKTRKLRQNEKLRVGDWVVLPPKIISTGGVQKFDPENHDASFGWVCLTENCGDIGMKVCDEPWLARREVKSKGAK